MEREHWCLFVPHEPSRLPLPSDISALPLFYHSSAFFHLRSHSSFSEPPLTCIPATIPPLSLSVALFCSLFLWFCISQQHFLPFLFLSQVREPDPIALQCIFSHDSRLPFKTKMKLHWSISFTLWHHPGSYSNNLVPVEPIWLNPEI